MAGKKIVYNSILFDSEFEFSCYKILNKYFSIIDHPEFKLFDNFEYIDLFGKKHKVRDIKYTGDFMINPESLDKPLIIECKHGIITESYMIRKKLFLSKYHNQYYFIQIDTIKELNELIINLKGETKNEKQS